MSEAAGPNVGEPAGAALLLPLDAIAVVTWATTLSAVAALAGLAAGTLDPGPRACDVVAGTR